LYLVGRGSGRDVEKAAVLLGDLRGLVSHPEVVLLVM
jgi:hypothetical protein